MPLRRLVLAAAVALGFAAATLPLRADAEPTSPAIVVLRRSVDPAAAVAALALAHGIRVEHSYVAALHGFSARLSPRQREALGREPTVASVRDDRAVYLVTPVAAARRRYGFVVWGGG